MLTNVLVIDQLARVLTNEWYQHFKDAAEFYVWPVHVLLGIASRETNCHNIIGDNGNGYGIMQVDKRFHPEIVAMWKDVRLSVLKGAEILTANRDWMLANEGKEMTLTDSHGNTATFTVPVVRADLAVRAAVACYNSGRWPLYQIAKGQDPDRGTTGANYSTDVLARGALFAEWLVRLKNLAALLG